MTNPVKELANAAMDNVLRLMHASGTTLESNDYSSEKQLSVLTLIKTIRDVEKIRQEKLQQSDQGYLFNIFNSPLSFIFESGILDIRKFAVGNCYEMAMLALDYTLHNNPNCEVEIFLIGNSKNIYNALGKKFDEQKPDKEVRGSHTIAVFNRDPSSRPDKPETWGDAWVCDPWSRNVYPISEYMKMFLVQYYDEQEQMNKVIEYKKGVDYIVPDNFSLSHLRKELNIEYLNKTYLNELGKLKMNLTNILMKYQEALITMGDQNPTHEILLKILMNKIKSINNFVEQLDTFQPKLYDRESDFHNAFEDYNATIKKLLLDTVSHIEFTQHEIATLFPDKNLLQQIASLFFKQPELEAKKQKHVATINDAILQTREGLQNLKR